MNLNNKHKAIKLFVAVLLVVTGIQLGYAQEPKETDEVSVKYKFGLYSGLVNPIGLHKNKTYAKGLTFNPGVELKALNRLTFTTNNDFVLFGLGFGLSGASVKNTQAMGNYQNSSILTAGFITGFGREITDELAVSLQLGVSYVEYKSSTGGINFRDDGVSYKIGPEVRYNFSKRLGAYFSVEYRYDHLNMRSPSVNGRNLDRSIFIVPTIGIVLF